MRDNGTLACSATMKASSGHLEETGSSACNEAPEKVCLLPANWAGRPPPRQGARAEAPDSRLAALTGRRHPGRLSIGLQILQAECHRNPS
jgi:hypothetical protein